VLGNKFPNTKNDEESKTATKVAELFNTNSSYVKTAKRLKKEDPEAFEDVKSDKRTITEVKKGKKN
jgi:hypothetical protein